MGKEFQDEETIDLLELFGMLWQHIFQILICTVVGAAIAFGVSKFLMVPQYQSSAMMIVNTRQDVNANVPEGAAPTMPSGHENRYADLGANGCYGCHGANQDANPMLASATALPADHYAVEAPTSIKDLAADHSQCITCHVPGVSAGAFKDEAGK